MMRWTGLSPWEFPFPGSLISTFQELKDLRLRRRQLSRGVEELQGSSGRAVVFFKTQRFADVPSTKNGLARTNLGCAAGRDFDPLPTLGRFQEGWKNFKVYLDEKSDATLRGRA